MKNESEGPTKLKTFVRQIGAPFFLMNDNSKMQTGSKWTEICNDYNIGTGTTEPKHPWQNPAERKIQSVKKAVNRLMDRTNCPEFLWFQCTIFICMLMNVMANRQLNWRTPMEKGLGITPDISPFLQFQWYKPVLFIDNDVSFPNTRERKGYWCGPTDNVGDAMTYWVLTADTNQLIARSNVRSALPVSASSSNVPINFRAYFASDLGENDNDTVSELLQSVPNASDTEDAIIDNNPNDESDDDNSANDRAERFTSYHEMIEKLTGHELPMSTVDPNDLVGYSFVRENDGVKQKATVSSVSPDLDKVTLTFMNGSEQLLEYNDFINIVNAKDEDGDGLHTYSAILDHRKRNRK